MNAALLISILCHTVVTQDEHGAREGKVLVEHIPDSVQTAKRKPKSGRLVRKLAPLVDHKMKMEQYSISFPSRIIQNFILREQVGALVPPSYDEHKARHSKRGGVMATVFSGRHPRGPNMSLDLSLEMNRKMQSVLEDTLLKNITLKVSDRAVDGVWCP